MMNYSVLMNSFPLNWRNWLMQQDMLPKLMTDAGYRWRDNDSGGTSVGIEDRVVSLRPSTSEEREHLLADATFSWDVLDFGMSYYRAKQQADNVNIAEERRRKVLQNIVQEVRDAYWRALGEYASSHSLH